MAKRHILVDATSSAPKRVAITNWELCVLCQEDTKTALQRPYAAKGKPGIGYKSLADHLTSFNELGHNMPMNVDIEQLNDGDGIEATLMRHHAGWHKACRSKFSQLKLERQQKNSEEVVGAPSSVHTRSNQNTVNFAYDKCFFCNEPAGSEGLHNASTYDVDVKVRRYALELEDTALLAKLVPGDMIALEAKYHRKCLTNLYNRARTSKNAATKRESNDDLHGIALAELVTFMEEYRREETVAPVFKLSDLADMYRTRLEQLGVVVGGRIHTSRLKIRLMAVFPDLRAHTQGKHVILTFDGDVCGAFNKACDYDDDAMHLARAAEVVRREIFDRKCAFDGSFKKTSESDTVPPSLMALVNMILDGPNIKHQSQAATASTRAALSISQLLIFNSVKNARDTASFRHQRVRETPLPLYVAMKMHATTRKRALVDAFSSLGLCVAYDRLLQVSSDLGNGVCEQFLLDGVVCPPKMRKGLVTMGAVDNLDHNPSSTTSKDSFHGTGISLMQHPSLESTGEERGVVVISQASSAKAIAPLPEKYTSVLPAVLKTKEFIVPAVQGCVRLTDLHVITEATKAEWKWLDTVMEALNKQTLENSKTDWISWSAYHANIQATAIPPAAINALLPLFLESAHSVAMIKHSMIIVQEAIQHLNPGQVPILAADQPLYALAKQIQWTWPDTLGEDHYVVMFGGLHIEMAILKVLGEWLEGSGWTNALVQADIASVGTADSFVKASHVTKTRHAHQVTAASIYALLHKAYAECTSEPGEHVALERWCVIQAQQSPQFDYWLKTLSLEIIMLLYIRAIREGNFQLYIESLTKIIPWMFSLDHIHYSRWLPVHVRDMLSLSEKHPEIFEEFCAGKFVVHKTSNKFSAMAIDQCHEQNNAIVKESGGAVGLTSNPSALRRWMVAGPEVARVVTEFEQYATGGQDDQAHLHHDQRPGVQTAFAKDVGSLIAVFQELGNPFLDKSQDLLVLDTRDIVDSSIVETVRRGEALGEEQYQTFVQERLEKREKHITEVITKNKLPLFRNQSEQCRSSRQKMQITSLKNDCSLFSRLYISCQTRDGDLDRFFTHENQATPPSLSVGGKIRSTTKSDLLQCFDLKEKQHLPPVDAKFLDGAAVVQMLSPGSSKTFQDYATNVFIPYVSKHLQTVGRIDIVWDVYLKESLKSTTREKRGKGVRRRVAPTTVLPPKWSDFLHVDDNKTELFQFLSEQVLSEQVVRLVTEEGKCIYATNGTNVMCSLADADFSTLAPCSHEEADTRLFLHVADAVRKGCRKVCVRTVDTDVIIIAIAMYRKINLDELWLSFGTKSNFRYIPIHEVVADMDHQICATLPVFHALTGCDTVSSFCGRGKKTAWNTWKVFPEATQAFEAFQLMQTDMNDLAMATVERFVVLLYNRTSGIMNVNDSRKYLFTQKARSLENIPPTLEALKQHTKRAIFQSYCWNRSLFPQQELPNPADWGWKKGPTGWEPLWTTLSEASQACSELIRCGCKKGCTRRCKCVKAALKCTALCNCGGEC